MVAIGVLATPGVGNSLRRNSRGRVSLLKQEEGIYCNNLGGDIRRNPFCIISFIKINLYIKLKDKQ